MPKHLSRFSPVDTFPFALLLSPSHPLYHCLPALQYLAVAAASSALLFVVPVAFVAGENLISLASLVLPRSLFLYSSLYLSLYAYLKCTLSGQVCCPGNGILVK